MVGAVTANRCSSNEDPFVLTMCGLDLLLGCVELRPEFALLLRGEGLERRLQRGELARLAEETRLRVLERRGIARRAECGKRARDDAVEIQLSA